VNPARNRFVISGHFEDDVFVDDPASANMALYILPPPPGNDWWPNQDQFRCLSHLPYSGHGHAMVRILMISANL
jgi:hypothetical protein